MKNNRPQHPEQLLHLFHHVLGQPPNLEETGMGGSTFSRISVRVRFTMKNKH